MHLEHEGLSPDLAWWCLTPASRGWVRECEEHSISIDEMCDALMERHPNANAEWMPEQEWLIACYLGARRAFLTKGDWNEAQY